MKYSALSLALLVALGVAGCSSQQATTLPAGVKLVAVNPQQDDRISLPYKKYQLENGLTVIIHEDDSDPLVHVDVTYHVGSAREELGKSGFAHFFEHMMFQGSDNVGAEMHFKYVTEAGGTLNGTTNSDRTNYFQTVPVNQLEKMLWLESDRMGYFLDSVTQEKFDIQLSTVKNERGQRVDNQPYGRYFEQLQGALYPYGHPYSWPVIGHMDDLNRATMPDLKQFFLRWYGPNNATLTIGGAVKAEEILPMVQKYFGTIPAGPAVEKMAKAPAKLDADRYVSMEDNVHLPLISMTFPTVYAGHPDEAPLNILADILGNGNNSLLYQSLVRPQIAVNASAGHRCMELACTFSLSALPHPASGKNLADIEQLLRQNLQQVAERGVKPEDLARAKTRVEARSIFGLQSVAGKVSQLAYNEIFFGEPDRIASLLASYEAVTAEDVMRVYRQYVQNSPAVISSVVPRGKTELIAAADNFTAQKFDPANATTAEPLPMRYAAHTFDRKVVPQAGANPAILLPDTWTTVLDNGIQVLGSVSDETPTTSILLRIPAGSFHNTVEQAGLASMMAALLNESTENYSTEQMSMALELLGSSVSFSASDNELNVFISSLSRNLPQTLQLVQEKLLRPAFNAEDFNRIKQQRLQSLAQAQKNASYLAERAVSKLMFGDSIAGQSSMGSAESLQAMTLEQVSAFYQTHVKPQGAQLVTVSDLPQPQLQSLLADMAPQWQGKAPELALALPAPAIQQGAIYLVHKDQSPQSEIRIVRRAMPRDLTGDFYRAGLMNFTLGGNFNSRINLNLREDKGYTYGARSGFGGDQQVGLFTASAAVRADVTRESIEEFLKELNNYQQNGMTAAELNFMRSAVNQSEALRYETPNAKLGFMAQMLEFNVGPEFTRERNQILQQASLEQLNALASQYLSPSEMVIVVVGEADKLKPELEKLQLPIIELKL
ncbi:MULTISPECIES: pitrilysin family protein [unclassified Alishewanella]|uniref:M16 family metallopeptidase n=1 Tax=unclassified Alishewanella TaxID=2628974 RepID=UPI000709DE23|nr:MULTISPECIES: pitrilysin family protein [unclassified Alishewanella]KRS21657.1 peptidase M16 [Alishewanella sp. WH16-1]OCW96175.1 peptidase M16 [Alishewanella sp. HH-ZS]